MNNNSKFTEQVLFTGLKMITANVSLLIEKGCKDKSRLVFYTNYYANIVITAFNEYLKDPRTYTNKECAIKSYTQMHALCFNDALENPENQQNNLELKKEYTELDTNSQLVIMAIFMLSSFYKNNSTNKIKNILRTYSSKVRRTIKNSDMYTKVITNKYNELEKQTILFKFLVENS